MRGWHTDVFTPAMMKHSPEIFRFVEESVTKEASRFFPGDAGGDHRACSASDSAKAFLHRFVVAGASVRYRAVHAGEVADIVALDVALPRNAQAWVEDLPPALADQVIHTLYYGHFFCHVFHQDYIVRRGNDPLAFEHALWALLDARGAQYPAEHNVGHLYVAPTQLAEFYRDIDPRNQLNPGIGHTPRTRHWADSDGGDHECGKL